MNVNIIFLNMINLTIIL